MRLVRKRSPNRRMTQLAEEREYLLDIVFALAQAVPRSTFKQCVRSHEQSPCMAHLKLERFCPSGSTVANSASFVVSTTAAADPRVRTTLDLLPPGPAESRGGARSAAYHRSEEQPRAFEDSITAQRHQPDQQPSRAASASASRPPLPSSLYDDPEPRQQQLSECEQALQLLRSARDLEKKSIEVFSPGPTRGAGAIPQALTPHISSYFPLVPDAAAPLPPSALFLARPGPMPTQPSVFYGNQQQAFYPPPPPPGLSFHPTPGFQQQYPSARFSAMRPNVHDSLPESDNFRRDGNLTPRSSSNPWEVFRT